MKGIFISAHFVMLPFWLRTPAPLWTAPALDRCLLLALAYPVGTIFFIWVISGHVGPAEAALGLKAGLPSWQRSVALAEIGLFMAVWWRYMKITRAKIALYPTDFISSWKGYLKNKTWKTLIWFILGIIFLAGSYMTLD